MYKETLYHGSNRARGEKMIKEQVMELSRGENHWLGDGSYLFVEDFYSYKWILDMFKRRYTWTEDYNNIIKKYLILIADVCTDKQRVFDLTKAEHKMMFDKVHREMRMKAQIADKDMAEGVVLNYMFNVLEFGEDYDAVKALFALNDRRYTGFNTRLGHMPQEQVCIKNLNIVKDVREYNFKERVGKYEILISDMYYDKPKAKVKTKQNTYNMKKNNYNMKIKKSNFN
ncbi:hypothetical protein [Bacillus cereus]|uniref:hypothetical protein n=2 Tax=Bacillus cereus group TaxID=86661 RepID=UPI000BEDC588|nr:hypothetical protein [Bacillus cereus]PDY15651.1 hypothetical protein COM76_28375 [Bacillus cereus]PEC78091.1 hypothetical protein CON08_19580 [Bacillus cereus]PEE57759.1 hypothetical protein COM68_16840 [Bacillus cereus]PEU55578.1 hypothetical protein CN414_14460 [Bacillus cereus]PEX77999.1 hypothetical protein CN457_17500 [Bacillus cereus]